MAIKTSGEKPMKNVYVSHPQRNGSRNIWLMIAGVATVVAVALCAVQFWISRNPLMTSPEGRDVNKWLTNKRGDPEYTVVRWWPARDSIAVRDIELQEIEQRRQSDASLIARGLLGGTDALDTQRRLAEEEADLKAMKALPSVKICRLKYRAKNDRGGMVLLDHVFELTPDYTFNLSMRAERYGGGLPMAADDAARRELPD